MQKQSKLSYLILPIIPIIAFLIYFTVKSINTPSSEKDVSETITQNYNNNIKYFSDFIYLIKTSNSVWKKFEIHFHPGLGTKFHGYGYLDTTKISESNYKRKYIGNSNKMINDVPDFNLDGSILEKIKSVGISKIECENDSVNTRIQFLYKYRKFNPADYDYYISYSNGNHTIPEQKLIWERKINDSVYCYAIKSN